MHFLILLQLLTAVKGKGCQNWIKPTETKFNLLKLVKAVDGVEKTVITDKKSC
jgi:hypothetical protein